MPSNAHRPINISGIMEAGDFDDSALKVEEEEEEEPEPSPAKKGQEGSSSSYVEGNGIGSLVWFYTGLAGKFY